ncbi:MAG: hypothetical protein Q8M57_13810, partial [Nitrosomonas sp.]|uniref:hypothetical protein n=1 Tax=Nitrosomonas sp. TaxID=42353 RepID=UPI002735FA6C
SSHWMTSCIACNPIRIRRYRCCGAFIGELSLGESKFFFLFIRSFYEFRTHPKNLIDQPPQGSMSVMAKIAKNADSKLSRALLKIQSSKQNEAREKNGYAAYA